MEIGEIFLIEHFSDGEKIFMEFTLTEEEAEKRVSFKKEDDERKFACPSKFEYKITKVERL